MSGSGSADGAAALDPRREALAGADDTVTASTSGSGAPFVTVPLSSTPKASEEGAVAAAASEAAGPSSGAAAPGGGASSQQPSPEAFRWASDAEEHDDFEIVRERRFASSSSGGVGHSYGDLTPPIPLRHAARRAAGCTTRTATRATTRKTCIAGEIPLALVLSSFLLLAPMWRTA